MADSGEPEAPRGRGRRGGTRQQMENPNHVHINARCPVSFYTALTRHDEVHLSGLGAGVLSVTTVVELLKSDGLAEVTKIITSLVFLPPIPSKGMPSTQKPKLEVVITKSAEYDDITQHEKEQKAELMAAQVAAHAAATADAMGNLTIAAT